MEVHHHSHTERKKWTHYFWEFFMLFLAVTLGFFVENQREHYVEHLREKQYVKSLYDDLAIDTFVLQRTIDEKSWIKMKFDSVERILTSRDIAKNNEFIYYVERYINKVDLYKNIADYYNLYSRYHEADGSFGSINKNELLELESKVFDPQDLASLDNYHGTNFYDLALPANGKLDPISIDKALLKSLYIHFANAKYRSNTAIVLLNWLKVKAIGIMEELKKEYHLSEGTPLEK